MKDLRAFLQSGIIESYVLGLATAEEILEVEEYYNQYSEVKNAIDSFSELLEEQARANSIAPDPLVKPLLMATLNFIERMEKGEAASFPPELNASSTISEYSEWLERPDMVLPADFTEVYARIIGYTPQITTAIVWIKEMAPQEVHNDEYEKFLIVEGTCTIKIEDDEDHFLKAGDFLAIPLYKKHSVHVSSNIPCKVVLQRVAA